MRGRSPEFHAPVFELTRVRRQPKKGAKPRVFQSIGRTVTVLAATTEGPRGRQRVVSHERALCFNCSPRDRGAGMAPDSWRPTPVAGVVVAPKLKKRKSRAKV